MLDPKCIYRKSIFAKYTRLACLLSFASLFFTLSVTKFFLISTRWFMSFVLFASILKQGFRLTDKTERVPKEVLKK